MTARPATWAWLDSASCADRPDLPWIAAASHVSREDAQRMRAVCRACPALDACQAAASSWRVTGGWWAGAQRDPDVVEVEELMEPAEVWVPVTVGRDRRALTGVMQALIDIGGAA
jgi:hypothetical protein